MKLCLIWFLTCFLTTVSNCFTISQNNEDCEVGWTQIGSRCFHHFTYKVNFYEAQFFCRNLGAILASIHSHDELEHVTEFLNRKSHSEVIIGGFRFSGSEFQWSDGSPWNYSFWDHEEPNNEYSEEHCVELVSGRHVRKWNDEACSTRRKSFLCAKKASKYVHN